MQGVVIGNMTGKYRGAHSLEEGGLGWLVVCMKDNRQRDEQPDTPGR